MTRNRIYILCVIGLLTFVGCESEVSPSVGQGVMDKRTQRLAAAEMDLAMADVLSVEGATVRAHILDSIVIIESGGVANFVNTPRKGRLADGGGEIAVWVPIEVSVPEGSLVDVRVGEYGYNFEALIDD